MNSTFIWKEFPTKYPLVPAKKIVRTPELCLIRAKYFLGAKLTQGFLDSKAKIVGGKLFIFSDSWHKEYAALFEFDAAIRWADDQIDEDLVQNKVIDFPKIFKVIEQFERECPEAKETALIYRHEMAIRQIKGKSEEEQKQDLFTLIETRMSDLLFLMEKIVEFAGTSLNPSDLDVSRRILRKWEEVDAIYTDARGIRGNRLKDGYNLFIFSKIRHVDPTAITKIIKQNISEMSKLFGKLTDHPYSDFVEDAVNSTGKLYKLFYGPLIKAYQKSEDAWLQSLMAKLV